MADEMFEQIEGPGLPLVARLYTQGRYQRASVDVSHHGKPLTYLGAAGEWRQKAILRQAMIDDLAAQITRMRAEAPTHDQIYGVVRGTGYVTHGQAHEITELLLALIQGDGAISKGASGATDL